MRTEKSQLKDSNDAENEVHRVTRFTEFPALSVDHRVKSSRSASVIDVWLFFLHVTLKLLFIIRLFIYF